MLNLTHHQFQQKLADFAKQQLICEYDCGQKIVRVNINDFIKQLLREAQELDTDNARIATLRKKWGISDIAEEIICDVPSSNDFKTANILPLQLELHHHFSLIVAATKQHLQDPHITDTPDKGLKKSLHRTFVKTQNFITSAISGHADTGSSSASSQTADTDTSTAIDPNEVDHIYQVMMLEINFNIFEEIKNILPTDIASHHFTIMQAYIEYLQKKDTTKFYAEMAKFNSEYESLIKKFLDGFELLDDRASNSNNQNVSSNLNVSNLNKELDKLRASIAQKYYIYYFNELDKQGAALNKSMVRAIEKLLPQTPADLCDKLIQNSTTGGITYVAASPHTSHAKHYNQTALRQIIMSHMPPGKLLYRLESIAATDETDAEGVKHTLGSNKDKDELFFNDVVKKFTDIQNRIAQDLKNQAGKELTSQDVVHYNLLTSYGSTTNLKNLPGDDEAKTHQNWSTEVILEGIHRKNQRDLNKAPLFLLCNLGVNGFGIGTTEGVQAQLHGNKDGVQFYLDFHGRSDKTPSHLQRMTNEIFSLAEISILSLLAKKMPESHSQAGVKKLLRGFSNAATDFYTQYLSARKSGDLFSESQVYLFCHDLIATAKTTTNHFLSTLTKTTIEKELSTLSNPIAKTEYLLSLAIAKIFSQNGHLYAKNGMLVQSLLVALQDLTIAGCKSANERFANVQGLAEAAYHAEFQAALSTFITTKTVDEKQDITPVRNLYDNLAIIFNKYYLYSNGGYVISLSDQGSGPKTEAEDDNAILPNTNRILNNNVDDLAQTEAEDRQAHKMEKHHTLCKAFDTYKKEMIHLQTIVSDLQNRITQITTHSTSIAVLSKTTMIFSDTMPPANKEDAAILTFVTLLSKFKTMLDESFSYPTQDTASDDTTSRTGRDRTIINNNPAIIYAKTLQLKSALENSEFKDNKLGEFYGTMTLINIRANVNLLLQFYEDRFPHYKALSHLYNNDLRKAADTKATHRIEISA